MVDDIFGEYSSCGRRYYPNMALRCLPVKPISAYAMRHLLDERLSWEDCVSTVGRPGGVKVRNNPPNRASKDGDSIGCHTLLPSPLPRRTGPGFKLFWGDLSM